MNSLADVNKISEALDATITYLTDGPTIQDEPSMEDAAVFLCAALRLTGHRIVKASEADEV